MRVLGVPGGGGVHGLFGGGGEGAGLSRLSSLLYFVRKKTMRGDISPFFFWGGDGRRAGVLRGVSIALREALRRQPRVGSSSSARQCN